MHLVGVLDHFDIVCSKLVRIEFEEPLRNLRKACELRLFVDKLLTLLLFKESLSDRALLVLISDCLNPWCTVSSCGSDVNNCLSCIMLLCHGCNL